MDEIGQLNSAIPELKKHTVWTEKAQIVPKELIIPVKSPDSGDDIPTIPDLDDLQDILEKEISKPLQSEQQNTETVNALSEVGAGFGGNVEGVEEVLNVLKSYMPPVESDTIDTVWTVDTLLQQLADEDQQNKAT